MQRRSVSEQVSAVAVLGGLCGWVVWQQYRSVKEEADLKAQLVVDAAKGEEEKRKRQRSSTRVNLLFFRRLARIIRIIMPSWRSKELLHLLVLTALLFGRTALSIKVADITGSNVRSEGVRE